MARRVLREANVEWLSTLAQHPRALESLLDWLKAQERLCAEQALDGAPDAVLVLRGKRDSFRELRGFIHNNFKMTERSIVTQKE
jgi:hypothetical protein